MRIGVQCQILLCDGQVRPRPASSSQCAQNAANQAPESLHALSFALHARPTPQGKSIGRGRRSITERPDLPPHSRCNGTGEPTGKVTLRGVRERSEQKKVQMSPCAPHKSRLHMGLTAKVMEAGRSIPDYMYTYIWRSAYQSACHCAGAKCPRSICCLYDCQFRFCWCLCPSSIPVAQPICGSMNVDCNSNHEYRR